ncbi:MAG TPA: mitofilin family membrane protein [Mesorhizobium sp.]|jgi:hypothetical protein|nr:mitofilin family membrane protein [Mesorhizobium sp.]
MVKTPRTRSDKARPATTIELGPESVQRIEEPLGEAAEYKTPADAPEEPFSGPAEAPADAAPPFSGDDPLPPLPTEESDASARAADAPFGTAEPDSFAASDGALPPRDEEPARPDATLSAPPPTRRGGRGGSLLAGLLGGVAALALFAGLQFAGVLPGPRGQTPAAADTSAIEAEVAALRQELSEFRDAPQPPPADVSAIQAELTGLREQVTSLQNAPASAADPAASQAVDALRAEVAQLNRRPIPDIRPLEERLGALEQRLAEQGTGEEARADIQALTERVAAAEALAQRNGEAAAEAARRVGSIETALNGLSTRVDALGQQPKIALAIATSALKSAVDRGAPFAAELATLRAIAPDLPEAHALDAYAETGVATREQLLADWDTTADAILAAAEPPDPNAGFFDRLLTSAENLVSVRPVGAVAGEGVGQRVARMEVALNNGDLAQAMAEFDTLPEPAKAAAAGFAERARARLEVERLVDAAISNAMQAA